MLLLQPGRINQRTQRAYGAALLANHFAHVGLRHAHFNPRRSIALNLAHVNSLCIVDERFNYHFNRVAHLGVRLRRLSFRRGLVLRSLFDQSSHRISGLCAFADPVLDAIALEIDFRGLARWIVRTEVLKERSVTFRLLFFNYDAIAGALLGAGSH